MSHTLFFKIIFFSSKTFTKATKASTFHSGSERRPSQASPTTTSALVADCFIVCVSQWALFDKLDSNIFFFFFFENPNGNIWPSLTAQLGYFDNNSCSVFSLSNCSVKKKKTVPLTLNTSWNLSRNSRNASFVLLCRGAKFIVKFVYPRLSAADMLLLANISH